MLRSVGCLAALRLFKITSRALQARDWTARESRGLFTVRVLTVKPSGARELRVQPARETNLFRGVKSSNVHAFNCDCYLGQLLCLR